MWKWRHGVSDPTTDIRLSLHKLSVVSTPVDGQPISMTFVWTGYLFEWEKKMWGESWRWDRHLIYSHNFTAALVCRCSYSFDWSINRTGCCRWQPTARQTGHWSSHDPLHPQPPTGTTLIILPSYLNLLQKAHQVTDRFNLLCNTGSLFVTLSM